MFDVLLGRCFSSKGIRLDLFARRKCSFGRGLQSIGSWKMQQETIRSTDEEPDCSSPPGLIDDVLTGNEMERDKSLRPIDEGFRSLINVGLSSQREWTHSPGCSVRFTSVKVLHGVNLFLSLRFLNASLAVSLLLAPSSCRCRCRRLIPNSTCLQQVQPAVSMVRLEIWRKDCNNTQQNISEDFGRFDSASRLSNSLSDQFSFGVQMFVVVERNVQRLPRSFDQLDHDENELVCIRTKTISPLVPCPICTNEQISSSLNTV